MIKYLYTALRWMGFVKKVPLSDILITFVPHAKQRYETMGDWYVNDKGQWVIVVDEMGDWRKSVAVAIHELVEMSLCMDRGIEEQDVTDFDLKFNATETPGESGDEPDAPYHKEHRFATHIEREIVEELGVEWGTY
jgi:hypothetical protein